MPWSVADVDSHMKGLTDAQKKAWVKIANSVLRSCLADGGKDCEGKAIRIANSKAKQTNMSREPIKVLGSEPLGDVTWDGTKFKKAIIGVGLWTHPNTKETMPISEAKLHQLADTFYKCKKSGINVWVPLNHTADPDKNSGWLEDVSVLLGPKGPELVGVFDITEPAVAEKIKNKTIKFVSPGIVENIDDVQPDGTLKPLGQAIQHVALTLDPVLQNQTDFVQMFDREGNAVPVEVYEKESNMPDVTSPAMTDGTSNTYLAVSSDGPLVARADVIAGETDQLITELAKMAYKDKAGLPDSCFAMVYKDAKGNTVRKLQYRKPDGSIDPTYLRNLLARVNQDKFIQGHPATEVEAARKKLQSAAKKHIKSAKYGRSQAQASVVAEFGKLTDALKKSHDAKAMQEMYDHFCKLVSQSLYGGIDEDGEPFEAEMQAQQLKTVKGLTSEFLRMMKEHADEMPDEMMGRAQLGRVTDKIKSQDDAKEIYESEPQKVTNAFSSVVYDVMNNSELDAKGRRTALNDALAEMVSLLEGSTFSKSSKETGDTYNSTQAKDLEAGKENEEMNFDKLAEMTGIPVAELTAETYLDKLSAFMASKTAEITAETEKATAAEAAKVELEKTKQAMETELGLAKRQISLARLDGLKARIVKAETENKLTPAVRERVLGTFSLDATEKTAFDAQWDRQVAEIEGRLGVAEAYGQGAAINADRTDLKDLVDAPGQATPAEKLETETKAALELERQELYRRQARAMGIDPKMLSRDYYGMFHVLDAPKEASN